MNIEELAKQIKSLSDEQRQELSDEIAKKEQFEGDK